MSPGNSVAQNGRGWEAKGPGPGPMHSPDGCVSFFVCMWLLRRFICGVVVVLWSTSVPITSTAVPRTDWKTGARYTITLEWWVAFSNRRPGNLPVLSWYIQLTHLIGARYTITLEWWVAFSSRRPGNLPVLSWYIQLTHLTGARYTITLEWWMAFNNRRPGNLLVAQ